MRIRLLQRVLREISAELTPSSYVLDFGCGAGRTVYDLIDAGYTNAYGFDVQDYLKLRHPEDRSRFTINSRLDLRLPYADNTFDVVLSDQVFEHVKDQVPVFRELHRVMKPGGVAIHAIPGRYRPIEGHVYVPFSSVFAHRWWFKLWGLLGVRGPFQRGISADEMADRNAVYFVEKINYVPTSLYKPVWRKLGYDYRFIHQEFFDTHERPAVRMYGKVSRVFPLAGWLYTLVSTRRVVLTKRSETALAG
jgi:SAM-dependent methyltransferase